MDYLKVRNFEQFQAFKDGRPIHWIKLYMALLEDYEFVLLSSAERWHVIGLWILAAKTGNCIPNDPEFVSQSIKIPEPVNLDKLRDYGFLVRKPGRKRTKPYESVRSRTQSRVEKKREEKSREENTQTVATAPCADGDYELKADKLAEWKESFPGVDVESEIRSAIQWLHDNPTKRKQRKHTTRFFGNWLRKAAKDVEPAITEPRGPTPETLKAFREMVRKGEEHGQA